MQLVYPVICHTLCRYPAGCACNYTDNAQFNKCPAGYRCSRNTFPTVENDAVPDMSVARLQAICIPCDAGQFCGVGTWVKVGGCRRDCSG